MFHEIRALKFAVSLIGTLLFVAACSGSGEDDTTTSATSAHSALTELQSLLETPSAPGVSDAPERNIVRQTLDAADNVPIAGSTGNGSVSQISGGATAGAASVTIGTNAGGDRTFRIDLPHTDATTYLITTGTDLVGVGVNEHLVQEEFVQEGRGDTATFTEQTNAGIGDVVTFNEPQGAVDDDNPDGTGRLYVYLRTDIPESIGDDTDYLAYGFWIHDPVGTAVGDVPAIGVFVDSSVSGFPRADVDALIGTATYEGDAEGLYHEEVAGVSDFRTFTADASLTADFETNSVPGTVTGTVDNFAGLPAEFSTLSVTLASTVLTDADGGFFNAGTSATLTLDGALRNLTGTWGGKLYDDTDDSSNTDHPGTVAGTFGLGEAHEDPTDASRMNRRALLGIYWAGLQPPATTTDAP